MEFFTLFAIAVGLSMDAFAVSITNGIYYRKDAVRYGALSALFFGLFQGLMPLIGYFAGRTFSDAISSIDHWVALILLGFIGGKMVVESVHELRHPSTEPVCRTFTVRLMLTQALATSIDALAVGVSFAVMRVNILQAAGFIAVVTFLCCLVGVFLGKKVGTLFSQKAEIFGGLVLILIGLKIFLEHTLGL